MPLEKKGSWGTALINGERIINSQVEHVLDSTQVSSSRLETVCLPPRPS